MIQCSGCGALVENLSPSAPTHAYIGAAPGCWAVFGEVTAREYADPELLSIHHVTADVYPVQHPGLPERRSAQSVWIHLVSLCWVLEIGLRPEEATTAKAALASKDRDWRWLEPPPSRGDVTVVDVWGTKQPAAHVDMVWRWARSTWKAWSPHQRTIRQLADEALRPRR